MIRIARLHASFLLSLIFCACFVGQVEAFAFDQAPTKIIIPSADINISIEPAEIGFNTWQTSPITASFGLGSALPGTIGNTVIFAHTRPRLFANLGAVHVGDQIHVFTDIDWFVYEVREIFTVSPEDVSIIKQGQFRELTLFTCTGTKDVRRLVVKAALVPSTY